ncbi:GyrI-like domain-containing protein [Kribbella sp. NBC_00709]|uniref:GyrI-like domain-containing protein n=1 Tax=Kribbella sp. NBC_00709 TaxID=2975972 RepID=UPI002E2C40BF|nr:GyrI-like domain-containing protein [Kribbella sp. NBC_00709]
MRTLLIESQELAGRSTVVRRGTMTVPEMQAWFSNVYGEIASILRKRGIAPAGPPFARYRVLPGRRFEVEAGFPVAESVRPDGTVRVSSLPAGPAAVTVHVGPYDQLGSTYAAVAEWLRLRGATPAGDPWEIYLDPPEGDSADWRTEIVQPYHPALDVE